MSALCQKRTLADRLGKLLEFRYVIEKSRGESPESGYSLSVLGFPLCDFPPKWERFQLDQSSRSNLWQRCNKEQDFKLLSQMKDKLRQN